MLFLNQILLVLLHSLVMHICKQAARSNKLLHSHHHSSDIIVAFLPFCYSDLKILFRIHYSFAFNCSGSNVWKAKNFENFTLY